MRSWLLLPFAAALVSCTAAIPEGRFRCDTDADCPGAFVCDTRISRCVSALADMGPVDMGPAETGALDLGTPDAGSDDAGTTDLGTTDMGPATCAVPCGANASCVDQGAGHECVCDTGYTGDGTTCSIVDCGAPPQPANGSLYDTPATTYGTVRDLYCGTGYRNPTAITSTTCQADGSWSTVPDCVDVDECAPTNTCSSAGDAAASCTNQPGSFTCTCSVGYTFNAASAACVRTNDCSGQYVYDANGACTPRTCNAAGDPDSAIQLVSIGAMRPQPSAAVGSNLDGLNNAAAAGGATVAGCGRSDAFGGIDNTFAGLTLAFASVVDIPSAMADLNLGTYIRITHAASTSAVDDPCIGIEVVAPGRGTIGLGSGSLVAGRVVGSIPGPMDIPLFQEGPFSGSCTGAGGVCTGGTFSARVTNSSFDIPRDANGLIAGSARWDGTMFDQDCSGGTLASRVCSGGAYSSVNATGLSERFVQFGAAIGLDVIVGTMFTTAFSSSRDLHLEPNAAITWCSGTNVTSTNRNALSFSFALTP